MIISLKFLISSSDQNSKKYKNMDLFFKKISDRSSSEWRIINFSFENI